MCPKFCFLVEEKLKLGGGDLPTEIKVHASPAALVMSGSPTLLGDACAHVQRRSSPARRTRHRQPGERSRNCPIVRRPAP